MALYACVAIQLHGHVPLTLRLAVGLIFLDCSDLPLSASVEQSPVALWESEVSQPVGSGGAIRVRSEWHQSMFWVEGVYKGADG